MHEYAPMQTGAPSMPLCSVAAVPRTHTGHMFHPTRLPRLPPRTPSRFPTDDPPTAVGQRSVRNTAQAWHAVRPYRSPKAPTAQAHVHPRALSPPRLDAPRYPATAQPLRASARGTPAPPHVAEQLGPGPKGGRRAPRPLTQGAQLAQHSALAGRFRVKPPSHRHAHASLLAPVETDSHTRVGFGCIVVGCDHL